MLMNRQTVLITGGSKGMGLAAAQQLAAKGANLIIVARGQESLSTALKHVTVSSYHPCEIAQDTIFTA
jgi:3-dehydrosphinganine reductase